MKEKIEALRIPLRDFETNPCKNDDWKCHEDCPCMREQDWNEAYNQAIEDVLKLFDTPRGRYEMMLETQQGFYKDVSRIELIERKIY